MNAGMDSPPTQSPPQFYGTPPGAWSFHDLDTPPNLQIEVTGVTSSMSVTVEAMDRMCPFPGTIGRTHADITLTHTVGDDNNPGNPWIDASSLTTFPVVTEAEVIAKYGSLIVNGQGWAGGPNVQATPPAKPPFAQPAPVNPPSSWPARSVTIAPMANPPAPPATFFDDFSNANDTFETMPLPNWTYPRDDAGEKVLQNSKWTVYANGYTCCSATAPDDGHGYADAYIENGAMNTLLGDWSQDVLSEISMFPRKAAHLNATTYLHVTYEVPSFATSRRYWVVSLCGSSTAGQTLDSTGTLKEQIVHTTFFYENTGANPSTAGWNCLQIFNREGNSNAFSQLGEHVQPPRRPPAGTGQQRPVRSEGLHLQRHSEHCRSHQDRRLHRASGKRCGGDGQQAHSQGRPAREAGRQRAGRARSVHQPRECLAACSWTIRPARWPGSSGSMPTATRSRRSWMISSWFRRGPSTTCTSATIGSSCT